MADCSRRMKQVHWKNGRLWQSWICVGTRNDSEAIWDYGLENKKKSDQINIPEQKISTLERQKTNFVEDSFFNR